MKQSPFWEADRRSASQEIPHILWNPKVQFLIYKCPHPEPDQSSQCPPSHILKMHLNIILPFVSFKWSFPSGLPTKTLYTPHLSPIHAPCQAHLVLPQFNHPINIWWGLQILKLSIYLSPLPCYLVPLRPKYSPQHPILKHPWPMFIPLWATRFHTHTKQQAIL